MSERQYMTHEPECIEYSDYEPGPSEFICICGPLRTAEQRGMLTQSVIEMDTAVINQNNAYDRGYADALTVAQEALELLPVDLVDARFDPSDERRYVQAVRLTTALAAIDGIHARAIAADLTRDGQDMA